MVLVRELHFANSSHQLHGLQENPCEAPPVSAHVILTTTERPRFEYLLQSPSSFVLQQSQSAFSSERECTMNLNQVTLPSTDIPRSVEFYKRLGLRQIVAAPHYARFIVPGNQATLSVEQTDRTGPLEVASVSVYFECDDLDDRVKDLKENGVGFETDPEDKEWLWREAWLRDPDGNRLCFYFSDGNRTDPPWKLK